LGYQALFSFVSSVSHFLYQITRHKLLDVRAHEDDLNFRGSTSCHPIVLQKSRTNSVYFERPYLTELENDGGNYIVKQRTLSAPKMRDGPGHPRVGKICTVIFPGDDLIGN